MENLRSFAWIVTVLSGLACSPTSPSPSIRITASVAALMVGEQWQFSAVSEGGAVRWASNRPDICVVSEAGVATALRPGVAEIIASSNGREASTTVRVVPRLDGDWSGQATTVSIRRLSGDGPSGLNCCLGTFSYSWRVRQLHDKITANDTTIYTSQSFTGTIDVDGVVALSASQNLAVDPSYHVDTTWTAQIDTDGLRLKGDSINIYRFTNFWGPQVVEFRDTFDIGRK